MQRLRPFFVSLLLTLVLVAPAYAAGPDLSKIENFAQNVIQVLVIFAGLLATVFFVIGGIGYITSSGNPEHLDKSKKTLMYSSIGLAVAIGAFVLSNVVNQLATEAFK
ncbi:MAG TPA: pilin [bacterium]|nr:pilin [bacterium]